MSFGVYFGANDGVDRKYPEYASSVVTRILDANVDGITDNQKVIEVLISNDVIFWFLTPTFLK